MEKCITGFEINTLILSEEDFFCQQNFKDLTENDD